MYSPFLALCRTLQQESMWRLGWVNHSCRIYYLMYPLVYLLSHSLINPLTYPLAHPFSHPPYYPLLSSLQEPMLLYKYYRLPFPCTLYLSPILSSSLSRNPSHTLSHTFSLSSYHPVL